jgi:hypothetical protein
MIYLKEWDGVFKTLMREFFIEDIYYVKDLRSWAGQTGTELSEPAQPLTLFAKENSRLALSVQSVISEESLNDVIKALGVRWALRDVASDPVDLLNSTKKKLAYCFLKEYARTLKDVGGNELLEDEWAIKEMEKLGFFHE